MRMGTPPPPLEPAPRDPHPRPECGAGDAWGHGAGGSRGSGRAQPAARGWGHARPDPVGWGLRFVQGMALAASPGSWGSGLLHKTEQCCGCSFAAEPRSWQGRGASKLDHNCSHLLASPAPRREQRVPGAARRGRAGDGWDRGIWHPGEDGAGSRCSRGENPPPPGGFGLPQPRPHSRFGCSSTPCVSWRIPRPPVTDPRKASSHPFPSCPRPQVVGAL